MTDHVVETHGSVLVIGQDHEAEKVSKTPSRRDLDIVTRVEDGVRHYEQVRQTHPPLEITAHDGVVTLTGNVRSRIMRQVIGQIAAQTPGVTRVENKIYDDPGLELAITLAFSRSEQAKDLCNHVFVSSVHGVVRLSGEVQSEQARQEATRLAEQVPSVRKVVDDLEVKPNS